MNYFKVYMAQLQIITGESWVQTSVSCFRSFFSSACIPHLTQNLMYTEEEE